MPRQSPVIEEVPYPVDPAALHAVAPQRYPFVLESAAVNEIHGRYDVVFAGAEEVLADAGERFLDALDETWRRERHRGAALAPDFPFAGGWFVYLGYELAAQIEPRLQLPAAREPAARAVRVRGALVQDHRAGRSWICAEPDAEAVLADLRRDVVASRESTLSTTLPGLEIVESEPEGYLEAVRRARGYIMAGDIYQTNLSREWRARLEEPVAPATLYARLRRSNPAPFAGLACFDDMAIVSSSPERLLRVWDGRVDTRPIAGTRPRGKGSELDRRKRSALTRSPKERAEHVMLIDLERNDLGRICKAGTVRVDEFMVMESYAHVHHIVSNVTGELLPSVTPGQAIAAVFPGGTITGCPKVRCMEIIAELEGEPRGAYTGSMGYLNHSGNLDFNILIRTIVQRGRQISWRAGAGIVADSKPERELEETRAKARGLLLALDATR